MNLLKTEAQLTTIRDVIADAMRQDAEDFERLTQEEPDDFILSHGRLSERVRRTALEVLVVTTTQKAPRPRGDAQ